MPDPAQDHRRSLYPFLYEPELRDSGLDARRLEDVRLSTLAKCRDVVALRAAILVEHADELRTAAEAMADRFARGGTLLAFGNGGSATDAEDAAADCLAPAFPGWRRLPALALTNDPAIVTAIANDVGFDNVFLRQVIAYGRPVDIALGISTSGNSTNVLAGLREAKRRGLLTVALTGGAGGAMAEPGAADFRFVARLDHIPRIQEGQATIWHTLLELVQARLGRSGVAV